LEKYLSDVLNLDTRASLSPSITVRGPKHDQPEPTRPPLSQFDPNLANSPSNTQFGVHEAAAEKL